ncbi:hypothetical protein CR956_00220 [Candidatus Saccharibacteria bacterium]|nr:MAG: hypothetical protein CR956_00220 [Candidatus Saccharibacteria bacterium]
MLVAGLVLALYFWVFFIGAEEVSKSLIVSNLAAIVAGVAFVIATISRLWVPTRGIKFFSFFSFTILTGLIAVLIKDTGWLASPFVALWMIASIFASVFGWMGYSLFLASLSAYIINFTNTGDLQLSDLIPITLICFAPLAIGATIWHRSENDLDISNACDVVAGQLSEVAGQSEIVIAAIADGVISLDKKGTIQLINPAAQKMIGWGKADALNLDYKSVLKLRDGKDKPISPSQDPIKQALSGNEAASSKSIHIETADSGKKFLASIKASPLAESGSAGAIVVFRDITKDKAEEREQAEFISTASHEMRTPVASIEGFLGLALNPSTAQIDDRAREYITKAQDSVKHLGRLFQDLLDVSKADDGRLGNNPRVINIVDFTQDIAQGLLPRAEEKDLKLIFKPRPNFGKDRDSQKRVSPAYFAEVDASHLREVLSNLIDNAIKYTFKGFVEIDINGDNSHINITIKDSGIGIPREDLPHLFQKFYRVDNTDTREIGGTGLGLYLCRRLIETIGGKIWVESQYKKGSAFHVQLPRLDSDEAQQKSEYAADRAAKQKSKPDQQTPEKHRKYPPPAPAKNHQDSASPPVKQAPPPAIHPKPNQPTPPREQKPTSAPDVKSKPQPPSKPKPVAKPQSKPVITTKDTTATQTIPYTTQNINDPNLQKGKKVVVQAGKNGLKRVFYRITYSNGVEIKRVVVKTKIITNPVKRIVKIGTKPTTPSGTYNYSQAAAVLTYVNQERSAAGLPALNWNANLAYYARIRAPETVISFSHTRPNGSPYYSLNPGLINGENLVAGTPVPVTAQQAVAKWMASPPHRANILHSQFKSMGAAYYIDNNGLYRNYWVQLFSVQP